VAAGLIPADRQKQITQLIKQRGVVKVNELSELFNVSVLTIRRDLDVLEEQGVLERSHGGAVLRQSMPVEPLFAQKEQRYRMQKQAIAQAAAQLIEDGDMVLINSGSTTLEIIRALADKRITIITNNIGAAQVADQQEMELILLGGSYRPQSRSVAGNLGLLALDQVYANKAIIGVDGFSIKYGLTTPIMQEADITRAMIEKTIGDVIVAADSTKIGVVSNFRTVPVDRIDVLITDEGGRDFFSDGELQKSGIQLILAQDSSSI